MITKNSHLQLSGTRRAGEPKRSALGNATFYSEQCGGQQAPCHAAWEWRWVGCLCRQHDDCGWNHWRKLQRGPGLLVIGIPASAAANGNVVGLLPGSGSIAGGQTVDTANTTAVFGTGTVVLHRGLYLHGRHDCWFRHPEYQRHQRPRRGDCAAWRLKGGTLRYPRVTGNSRGLDVKSEPRRVTITFRRRAIDTNGNSVTYAGSIGNGGSGGLTVTSSQPTIAHPSKTTLQRRDHALPSGTLNVTNTTTATGSGAVTVSGGALSGSGIIAGTVTQGGGTVAGCNWNQSDSAYNSGLILTGSSQRIDKITSTDLTSPTPPPFHSVSVPDVTSGATFTLFSSTYHWAVS